jgi:hypothetical protein
MARLGHRRHDPDDLLDAEGGLDVEGGTVGLVVGGQVRPFHRADLAHAELVGLLLSRHHHPLVGRIPPVDVRVHHHRRCLLDVHVLLASA